jgi:hypothetical protein
MSKKVLRILDDLHDRNKRGYALEEVNKIMEVDNYSDYFSPIFSEDFNAGARAYVMGTVDPNETDAYDEGVDFAKRVFRRKSKAVPDKRKTQKDYDDEDDASQKKYDWVNYQLDRIQAQARGGRVKFGRF